MTTTATPLQADIGGKRWLMLVIGILSQAAAVSFVNGLPFLLPEFRAADHLDLGRASLLVAMPSLGLVGTLVAWGVFVDRYGERLAMALGLVITAAVLAPVPFTHSLGLTETCFALGGAGAASVNAASGRVVMGWFSASERGLAMGARQMAQPLGVAIAALSLPVAGLAWGVRWAVLVTAVSCAAMALVCALLVVDPPRKATVQGERPENPYRQPTLWRIHASSALLVVPQFAVTVFSEEYLVSVRHWSVTGAGRILAVIQVVGALGRLGSGIWSDRVGSRLGPMRLVAFASMVAMVAVGVCAWTHTWVVLAALAVATVISVADNGLGFTATAEIAGQAWSGRALGMQNTAQNIVAFATPPVFALIVGATSYGGAFVICAVFPALGILTTPVKAESSQRRQ